ncbi:MAG: hypothetical protein H6R10_695 [Rhodocyclaceae bacterium]|nr:hypothetical protein [Rhodocyclaceae bacterium]
MPAAVVAVAGLAAGAAAASAAAAAGWVVAGGIGAAVISGVTSMAVGSALSSAAGLNKSPKSQSVDSIARGALLNTAGTVDPIMVVYGRRQIGGTRCLVEVSGESNEYLHIVTAHCEGPIAAIEEVYLDGLVWNDSKYAGLVTVERFLGSDDQAACQSLIDSLPGTWTANHRLRGVAYTYVKIKYDPHVFQGLPTITADIKGRLVYDPRNGTTEWSDNPALCTRDYLTHARYGRGIPVGEIDDASIIVSANVCDQTFLAPDGSTRKRHTCNGIINTDQSSDVNVVNIMSCCRGMPTFSARGYGLVIDKAEVPTEFEFNEDNIVGAWRIPTGSKRNRANRVRANWFNPDREWQPDLMTSDSPAFRADDNGLMLEKKLELPFTSNPYEAKILAEQAMRQSRFGIAATFRAFLSGMFCEAGDVVPITHSTPGWVAKPFRIIAIRLLSSDEVEVEVQEYDDSVYSLTPLTTPRVSPATNLPDPANVPAPTGLAMAMQNITQPDGATVPRMVATWTAPASAWVVGYEVAWRENDGPWDTATVVDPRFTIPVSIVGRVYDVRVRSISVYGGMKSAWAVLNGTSATPPIVAPAAPVATATGALFSVRLVWTFGDARQDIRSTEVWFASVNDRGHASFTRLTTEAFPRREYTHPGLSPGGGGYYWIRVVDTWGNVSAWYPASTTGGLYATAITDPSTILAQLQGALGFGQLAQELAAPIALIPGMSTDILQRAVDIDALSSRVLFERAVTDATISVDPVTGQINLLATANVTTDVEARLTQVETDLNAAEGTLTNTVATVSTLQGDMSSAQSQVSQLAGEVSLKASQAYVDGAVDAAAGALTVDAANAAQRLAETALRQALSLDAATEKDLLSRSRIAAAQLDIVANADDIKAEASARLILAAAVSSNAAAITAEQAVRTFVDAANASSISTLQARLDTGDFASVKQQSETTASKVTGIESKYVLQVQTMQGGVLRVAGMELVSGQGGSSVVWLADKFLWALPDGSGTPVQLMVAGVVNGQNALGMNGNLIVDGTVLARSLNVQELSAITARIGTLRTRDTGARTEIHDDVIKVFDANGVTRWKAGNLLL